MLTLIVDTRNVQRSMWPNMPSEEVVHASQAWAHEHGLEPAIVFDGAAPPGGIGTGRESADDWIARRAAELAAAGERYWLVTSDRELRRRAGGEAERVIGGGAFVRELQERR
jgi:hypothetical protein